MVIMEQHRFKSNNLEAAYRGLAEANAVLRQVEPR